jgi:hypothetical protein
MFVPPACVKHSLAQAGVKRRQKSQHCIFAAFLLLTGKESDPLRFISCIL